MKENMKEPEVIPDVVIDEELERLLRTALAKTNTNRKTAPKNIPLELLIVLRKKRLPLKAIARICKCSSSNVRERLRGHMDEIDMIDEYKNNRADVLAFHQRRVLGSITEKDLQEADLRDKSTSFGILYDKERIEMGKGSGGGNLIVAVVNFGDTGPKQIISAVVDVPSQDK